MGRTPLWPMLVISAALAACAAPPSPRQMPADIPGDERSLGPLPATVRATGTSRGGPAPARPAAEATGSGAELAFVTAILTDLQGQSFRANAEHCGYIGLDAAGALVATAINRGDEASCPLPHIPPGMTPLASFHTHGTYSPYYASEFPTSTDLMTDAGDRIDGYISTPGGRLWYSDSDTMTVRQLCGRGCLPQDPNYVAADDGPVRPMFSLAELRAFERS